MTLSDVALERLRRQIDDLAGDGLEQLLEEARIEARVQVRTLLVEAIAERMLAGAEAAIEAEPQPQGVPRADSLPPTPAPAPAAPAARQRPEGHVPQRLGWWVYGVVAEGYEPPEGLVGIDEEHHVTVIAAEGVAAVASRVSLREFGEQALTEHVSDLEWLEPNARRHERILECVGGEATLVPMRLCTIYETDTSVREMLAREHAFLIDALSRLEGCAEWSVKLFAAPGAGRERQTDDAPSAADEQLRRAGPGAAYLLEKRLAGIGEAEAQAALERVCEAAHTQLSALAVEAKLNPLQPRELTNREQHMVLNGVYLVDDEASSEFIQLAGVLQSDHGSDGIELELTGPWPAYNFVNDASEIGR